MIKKFSNVLRSRLLILLLVVGAAVPGILISSTFANAVAVQTDSVSAPQNVTASPSAASIIVTWSSPARNSSGTAVSGYVVEYSTTGLAGSWTVASDSISSSATRYVITGLSSLTTYYTRVAALVNSGAGRGAYGYQWTSIYKTTTPTRTITYSSTYSNLTRTDFSRVRYLLTGNGATVNGTYADVDFYKAFTATTSYSTNWDPTNNYNSLQRLKVPVYATSPSNNTFLLQGDVSDLTVVSDSSNITTSNGKNGRVEIWPFNYATALKMATGGSGSTYDENDTADSGGNYGSFQVHNMSSGSTVFAWNNPGEATWDFGYGDRATGNPDWTFAGNGGGISNFSLESFANFPVTTYK
jgi:hypothetical protein